MQTCKKLFYETLNSKLSKKKKKKKSVKFIRTSNSVYNFHMFLCLSTINLASHVLCLLTKFREFLKPVTVRENMICMQVIFDINNELMFQVSFILEPCNF